MQQRRNEAPRKSSLVGREVRAEARILAHKKSIEISRRGGGDKALNEFSYKMPAPGPLSSEQGKKRDKPFKDLSAAKAHIGAVETGTTPKGLRYCAAVDILENAYKEGKNGNKTANSKA